ARRARPASDRDQEQPDRLPPAAAVRDTVRLRALTPAQAGPGRPTGRFTARAERLYDLPMPTTASGDGWRPGRAAQAPAPAPRPRRPGWLTFFAITAIVLGSVGLLSAVSEVVTPRLITAQRDLMKSLAMVPSGPQAEIQNEIHDRISAIMQRERGFLLALA